MERGVVIGTTGSGKSTLESAALIPSFLNETPTARVFIADAKPRFRAPRNDLGLPVRYKNWVPGDSIDGAVLRPNNIGLKRAFQDNRVLVWPRRDTHGALVPHWEKQTFAYCEQLVGAARPDKPILLVLDEVYNLVHGLQATTDDRLLEAFRGGREHGLSVLAGSQRPRSIPVAILTEATVLYVFALRGRADRKYVAEYVPEIEDNDEPGEHECLVLRYLAGNKVKSGFIKVAL